MSRLLKSHEIGVAIYAKSWGNFLLHLWYFSLGIFWPFRLCFSLRFFGSGGNMEHKPSDKEESPYHTARISDAKASIMWAVCGSCSYVLLALLELGLSTEED